MAAWTAAAILVAALATATTQNVQANKAAGAARNDQAANLLAAKEAANQSKAATTTNVGDVSLDSQESLDDAAIRSKSTKNRLRVDSTTGLSLGTAKSATGLSI